MVAQVPDRRTGRLAGAAGIALLLVGLTLLLEPASRRAGAAVLLAAGLAAGVVIARRLPAPDRLRTPMERLNDAAFVLVIAAVSLVAVRLARPWTAALPGLVGGFLIGRAQRPRAVPGPGPGPNDPGTAAAPDPDPAPGHAPGPGRTPGPASDSDSGRAGTPPAGAEPPGGGA
jgi:hypothetical protein